MSISAIQNHPSTSSFQYLQGASNQRRQDAAKLASSLASGDLSGAQAAYTDLQSLLQTGSASVTPATSATSTASAVQTDFAALGQALTQGNVSQAQTDFNQLKTDMKAAHTHGHHHHHAAMAYQDPPASSDPTAANADAVIKNAVSSSLTGMSSSSSDGIAASLMSVIA